MGRRPKRCIARMAALPESSVSELFPKVRGADTAGGRQTAVDDGGESIARQKEREDDYHTEMLQAVHKTR